MLLDEIEKAHPDIFNILLQIMDYGKLKDQNGKNVDFRNVILILTSNIGASQLEKDQIGFSTKKNDTQKVEASILIPWGFIVSVAHFPGAEGFDFPSPFESHIGFE